MDRTDGQRDWKEFFHAAERQHDARKTLIDNLPIEPLVKELLKGLDSLARDELSWGRNGAKILPDGTVEITVPIHILAMRLGRSENTVRKAIDLAVGTPYCGGTARTHRAHTYLVRWQAIVSPPVARTSVSQCGDGRNAVEGVQAGVQRGVQTGVQNPVCTPPKTSGGFGGFQRPKNKSLQNLQKKPKGNIEGQKPTRPLGFWKRWRDAVEARNLADPADVDELYGLIVALAEGHFAQTADNRFQVFCQAAKCIKPGGADHPVGLFVSNVGNERWFKTDADEDLARRMMAAVDRGTSLAPRRQDAGVAELREQAAIDQHRAEMKRRLLAQHARLVATSTTAAADE